MSAEQPRVSPGVPASGQWSAYGHNDNVPGLQALPVPSGPVFGLRPEYFDQSDQDVYDRHEALLVGSGIDAVIEDNPVLLGGRTEFVAATGGRRFILGVTDTGVSVHRDPAEVPPGTPDNTGFITETFEDPTPDHIAEAMACAVRRARLDDALHAAGIGSTDTVEFCNFAVHERRGGKHSADLTFTTSGGSYRLETRGIGPGAEYGITDFAAGRFLTGPEADAVLLDAIAASGRTDPSAAAFIRDVTTAATAATGAQAPHHNGQENP